MQVADLVGLILGSAMVLLLMARRTDGHARLVDPPMRSSMWRYGFNTPINYNDNELFCGGLARFRDNGGKCGICGDPYDDPIQPNMAGGPYGTGIIGRYIPPGSTSFSTSVLVSALHKGYFEFRLCAHNSPSTRVSQECLNENLLYIEEGAARGDPYKFYPYMVGTFNLTLRIPSGLTCTQCVFQLRYRTGNSWGQPDENSTACLGCGIQEEFQNCADISIGHQEPEGFTTLSPYRVTEPSHHHTGKNGEPFHHAHDHTPSPLSESPAHAHSPLDSSQNILDSIGSRLDALERSLSKEAKKRQTGDRSDKEFRIKLEFLKMKVKNLEKKMQKIEKDIEKMNSKLSVLEPLVHMVDKNQSRLEQFVIDKMRQGEDRSKPNLFSKIDALRRNVIGTGEMRNNAIGRMNANRGHGNFGSDIPLGPKNSSPSRIERLLSGPFLSEFTDTGPVQANGNTFSAGDPLASVNVDGTRPADPMFPTGQGNNEPSHVTIPASWIIDSETARRNGQRDFLANGLQQPDPLNTLPASQSQGEGVGPSQAAPQYDSSLGHQPSDHGAANASADLASADNIQSPSGFVHGHPPVDLDLTQMAHLPRNGVVASPPDFSGPPIHGPEPPLDIHQAHAARETGKIISTAVRDIVSLIRDTTLNSRRDQSMNSRGLSMDPWDQIGGGVNQTIPSHNGHAVFDRPFPPSRFEPSGGGLMSHNSQSSGRHSHSGGFNSHFSGGMDQQLVGGNPGWNGQHNLLNLNGRGGGPASWPQMPTGNSHQAVQMRSFSSTRLRNSGPLLTQNRERTRNSHMGQQRANPFNRNGFQAQQLLNVNRLDF